jgi:predicted phage terminase large subunit-like protein
VSVDLTPEEIEVLRAAFTPRMNKYIPHTPTTKQAAFLCLPVKEAFYGGAAGGGKSDALMMAALQYCDIPGYNAIIFRKTYSDLSLPGALMDRSKEWLADTDAKWSDLDKKWTFPSGATLSFGYLENEAQKFRYASSEFQFIGWDELTQFTESSYRFLFSRLRRSTTQTDNGIPLRVRSAANPGGIGHEWVRDRFVTNPGSRVFIPAGLVDNPYLNREEYEESLMELDHLTRQQLMYGDWEIALEGTLFKREWFSVIDTIPERVNIIKKLRYWDLAATEEKAGTDPDFTAGCLLGVGDDGRYYILDVVRFRSSPGDVERTIQDRAREDGRNVEIFMEQEPGSSGVNTIYHYRRRVLRGYSFRGDKPSGSKAERARPVSSSAEGGDIVLLRGTWNHAFLDEISAFPLSAHKDQVDALSGAHAQMAKRVGPRKNDENGNPVRRKRRRQKLRIF